MSKNNRNGKPIQFLGRLMEHLEADELPEFCPCGATLYATRNTIGFGSYSEHPADWVQLKCRDHGMQYQLFLGVGKKVRGLDV